MNKWVVESKAFECQKSSPNGARFELPKISVVAWESRPVGAPSKLSKREPRADAPWAVESRPLGADARPVSRSQESQFGNVLIAIFDNHERRAFPRPH